MTQLSKLILIKYKNQANNHCYYNNKQQEMDQYSKKCLNKYIKNVINKY